MVRVTQSMLTSNMLRNLNNSFNKMSKSQEQITAGTKITRPSDDPVVAVRGMFYRREVDKIEQFGRNMDEMKDWLDTSDDALGQAGEAMLRVKDLVIQASNDTLTKDDRQKIKTEIDQIREHLQDLGNTKIGDQYIFSGTNTNTPLFVSDGGGINPKLREPSTSSTPGTSLLGAEGTIKVEVYSGIQLQVNTPGVKVFGAIDDLMQNISKTLETGTGAEIGGLLGGVVSTTTYDNISDVHSFILEEQAIVGARQNRIDLMESRLSLRELDVKRQQSLVEDVDYAKTISDMTVQESIHQAALSVGAKIIQQTLVDFIR